MARMMVAPAIALGVDLILFAEDESDAGAQVARHVVGDYTKLDQLLEFARKCEVVTFEHERVPLSVIRGLEAEGVKVYPSSSTYIYWQDKVAMREKLSTFLSSHADDNYEIAVIVARSPHGQATSWAPIEIVQEDGTCTMTIAPAQKISPIIAERAQQIALEIAREIGVVGVMAVEMSIASEQIGIKDIALHPHNSGYWSIEGSHTSQFEQHLRAILDLPLGSPAMNYKFAVTGNVLGGDKTDMYRPYLHLMARNPRLNFHQYRIDVLPGGNVGHITACGDDLTYLIHEVEHASDYMSGVIDE